MYISGLETVLNRTSLPVHRLTQNFEYVLMAVSSVVLNHDGRLRSSHGHHP